MAITRTAKGTAASKAGADPWTALTSITMTTGDTIVVGVVVNNGISVAGVTWNGTSLGLDAETAVFGVCIGYVFSLANVTGGTGDIVVDFGTSPDSTALFALSLSGIATASHVDRTTDATGASDAPSSGATAATTQNDEFLLGAVFTRGPSTDTAGTWGGDTTTTGQRVGTTGASANSNATASEGYDLQVATGTRTASKSGITSRSWGAAIVTYKAAAAVLNPGMFLMFPQGRG